MSYSADLGIFQKPLNMIAQLKIQWVGIQVSLDRKIGLAVFAYEMVQQGDGDDQGQVTAAVISD
jgi:hypothetical protein